MGTLFGLQILERKNDGTVVVSIPSLMGTLFGLGTWFNQV